MVLRGELYHRDAVDCPLCIKATVSWQQMRGRGWLSCSVLIMVLLLWKSQWLATPGCITSNYRPIVAHFTSITWNLIPIVVLAPALLSVFSCNRHIYTPWKLSYHDLGPGVPFHRWFGTLGYHNHGGTKSLWQRSPRHCWSFQPTQKEGLDKRLNQCMEKIDHLLTIIPGSLAAMVSFASPAISNEIMSFHDSPSDIVFCQWHWWLQSYVDTAPKNGSWLHITTSQLSKDFLALTLLLRFIPTDVPIPSLVSQPLLRSKVTTALKGIAPVLGERKTQSALNVP